MRTVLVIDDDADVRASLAEALARDGFRVRLAHDGADAFAQLARDPTPDAILLDLGMPYMTGWQFRDLQKRNGALADIPVVVVTGHSPVGVDAEGVLQKPFGLAEVGEILRHVIGSRPPPLPRPAEVRASRPAAPVEHEARPLLGSPLLHALP